MQILICSKYKIIKKISQGAFGQIFFGINIQTGQQLAIKLQSRKNQYQQLLKQSKIITHLLNDSTVIDKGIPNVYYHGNQGDFNVLVMDLLAENLQELLQQNNGTFTIKTTLMLAEQLIKRLQYVHSKGYLHRDVKPQNFLIGKHDKFKSQKIYIIDFGLSKKYLKENKQHLQYIDNRSMTGTVRYLSINTHMGIEPTRRDDLQSVIYIIYYFLYGSLPWQGIKANSLKQKYQKILSKKIQYKPQKLFENITKQIRSQLIQIFKYIRGLKYDQKPNYEMIKLKLRLCLKNMKLQYDYIYDWVIKTQKQSKYKKQSQSQQKQKLEQLPRHKSTHRLSLYESRKKQDHIRQNIFKIVKSKSQFKDINYNQPGVKNTTHLPLINQNKSIYRHNQNYLNKIILNENKSRFSYLQQKRK